MNESIETTEKVEIVHNTQIPQHNTFEFKVEDTEQQVDTTIIFNSDFDSGNCGKVIQKSSFEYDIYTSPDRDIGTDQEGYSKSWFYFSVKGFKMGQSIKLNIQQIHMLWSLWNNKACSHYKPVFKINQDGQYQKLQTDVQIQMVAKNWLVLTFEYAFDRQNSEQDEVFFCFSYPYEYKKCIEMVKDLQQTYANDQDIYLHADVIAQSTQQRDVHLITISSYDGILDKQEDYISPNLFPQRNNETRAKRFRSNKPCVLITSRVHPGETPSSFALDGIIKFLLNKKDLRAALLRQFFVFQIVPMLNPDGVYNGHYRMDTYNNNLNRFYKIADPQKQPSVYAIRKLVEYLQEDKRLFFYIDLHAHAGKKGHFVYGNACDDLVMQIENQTFAKILSMNCKNFEYNYCNFSKKHMKARDKFEEMTKEGCGRVQVHQITNNIHAYTLECGFHQATQLNQLPPIVNPDFKINDQFGFEYDPAEDSQSDIYKGKKEPPTFTPILYEDVGKAILVSILDIFEKNPYSRIPNSSYKNIDNIRRSIGWDCARLERFRKDPYAYKKARKYNEFIQEAFFNEFERKKVFNFDGHLFKNIQWPDDLTGNFLHRYVHHESPKQSQLYKRQNKYYQIKSRIFEKRIISCSNIDEYYSEEYTNQSKNGNGVGILNTHKDNFNTEIGTFSNFIEDEKLKKQMRVGQNSDQKNFNESNESNFLSSDFDQLGISNNQNKQFSKSESPQKQSRHMSMICHIPPIKSQNIQIQHTSTKNDQISFIYMGGQQNHPLSNSEKKFHQVDDGDSPIRPTYNALSKKKKKRNYEQYLSEITKNNNILQLSLHQQFNGNQAQNLEIRNNKQKQKILMSSQNNDRTIRQFRMSSLNGTNETQTRDLQQLNIQGNDRMFYIGGEQATFQSKYGQSQQLSNPTQLQLLNKSLNNKRLLVSSRVIDKSALKYETQLVNSEKDSLLGSNHPSSSKLSIKKDGIVGHHKNSHSMTSYNNIGNSSLMRNIQIGSNGLGFDDERIISAASTHNNLNHLQSSNFIGFTQTDASQQLTCSSKSDLKIKRDQQMQQLNSNNPLDSIKRTTSNQSSQSSQEDQQNKKVIRLSDTLNLMHDQIDENATQPDQSIPESSNPYQSTNQDTSELQNLQLQASPQKQIKQFKCYNIMDFPPNINQPGSNIASTANTQYGQSSIYQQNQLKYNPLKKQPLQKMDQFYTQKIVIQPQNLKSFSQQPTQKKKDSPTINSNKKKTGAIQKNNKLFDVIFSNPSQQTINYSNYNKAINNQEFLSFNPDNEERQCEAITRIFSNFPGIAKQGIIKTERKQINGSFHLDESTNNRNRKSEGGNEQFIKQINLFNSSTQKQQDGNDFKLPDLKEGAKYTVTEEDQNINKLILKSSQRSQKY